MRGMLAPSSTESFASTPKIMMIKSIQFSVRQFSKQRPLTVALSSSEKSPIAQAVIGIASASALAAAAFVLIRNNASASASSPSRRRPSRNEETPLEDSNRNNNTNHMMSTSVFSTLQQQQQYSDSSSEKKPRWMQLGWKRSADAELALIEAKRAREAAHELEFWDRRWKLRKKTLPELRNMAAKMKISGRTKMRKPELVSVLEERLGLASDSAERLLRGVGSCAHDEGSGLAHKLLQVGVTGAKHDGL